MKYAHLVKLTVFSYENEDKNAVLNSFLELFPFRLDENKVVLKKTDAVGFSDKNIEIYEVHLTKVNLINQFLRHLLGNLNENQKNTLLEQAETRLDENLDFFIRFDKGSWTNGKRLQLTDSGKCFHLKISIAAFPKKRKVALKIINEMLSLR